MTAAAARLLHIPGSDAELLALLRSGEPAGFVTVMRRYNQRLYRLARSVLRDDAEAEEAVQEGYVRAFTHLDGFKGESSLATWLGRIVLNEALGRLRRRRPTIDINDLADELPGNIAATFTAHEPTPEQAIARQEIRRAVERAIDALPPAFRAVFVLRSIEQMSIEETAGCLGIPPQTVKTRLHRANKLLRQALNAEFGSLLDGAFPFLGARCDRLTDKVLLGLGLAEPGFSAPLGDRPAPATPPRTPIAR